MSKAAIDLTNSLNNCLSREFFGIYGFLYYHIIVNQRDFFLLHADIGTKAVAKLP